jgi:tryptophanase
MIKGPMSMKKKERSEQMSQVRLTIGKKWEQLNDSHLEWVMDTSRKDRVTKGLSLISWHNLLRHSKSDKNRPLFRFRV